MTVPPGDIVMDADNESADAAAAAHHRHLGNENQMQLLRALHVLTGRLGETSLKTLVNETVSVLEQHYIEAALAITDGNRSAAAKMLGLSRQSLYMKLARYEIGTD